MFGVAQAIESAVVAARKDNNTVGSVGCRKQWKLEEMTVVADLPSFDNGVGKVPLLIGADATVVVHEKDGLVQKCRRQIVSLSFDSKKR
ncbi:hypothetical protein BHE74_00030007 [Ensete ventricosum]|nr:hypothetical protein BHE74_00030007 [Ensete ventricosum]